MMHYIFVGMVTLVMLSLLGPSPLRSPAIAIAQDTTIPPRPKIKNDGNLEVPGAGYSPRFYIQANKKPSDQDAAVFHEPVVYLVARATKSANGSVLRPAYSINEKARQLTLWLRVHSDTAQIHEILRSKLTNRAKKVSDAPEPEFKGVPYDIRVLNPSWVYIASTQDVYTENTNRPDHLKHLSRHLVSKNLTYASFTEKGDIPVYFQHDNIRELEAFVEDLQGVESLAFLYSFHGVATLPCEAVVDSTKVSGIEFFKKVTGKGGVGFVTRDQAADVARNIVQAQAINVRCHNIAAADDLVRVLLKELGKPERIPLEGSWAQLIKLVALDQNSLKADVEKKIKEIRNDVVRRDFQKAFADSSSESQSWGVTGGFSVGKVGVSAGYSEADAEAASQARKTVEDTMKKRGIYIEYDEANRRYIAKSVDLHTRALLRDRWGITHSIRYEITTGEEGGDSFTLTREAWTEVRTHREWRDFEKKLVKVETDVTRGLAQIKDELTADYQQGIAAAFRFGASGSEIAKYGGNGIAVRTAGRGSDVWLDASDDVHIDAKDDVRISAEDEVVIDANDTVSIIAKNKVTIEPPPIVFRSCYYQLQRGEHDSDGLYKFNTGEVSPLAIIADVQKPSDCNDDSDVFLRRMGGSSNRQDNWHINISNWWRCEEIRVRVLFMYGPWIRRDSTSSSEFDTAAEGLVGKRMWCAR